MTEQNTPSPAKQTLNLVPLGLAALSAVAFSLQLFLGPFAALLTYLAPLPLYYAALSQSPKLTVIAILLVSLPMALFNLMMPVGYLLVIGLPVIATITLTSLRRTDAEPNTHEQSDPLDIWQGLNRLPLGTLSAAFSLFCASLALITTLIYESNLYILNNKIKDFIEPFVKQIYTHLDPAQIDSLLNILPLAIPVFAALLIYLVHCLNISIASRITNKNKAIPHAPFEAFSTLRLPTAFIYISALLMVFTLSSVFNSSTSLADESASTLGKWILFGAEFFSATALAAWFITGLATFQHLTNATIASPSARNMVRIAIYILLIFAPYLGLGLTMLALFDAIIDLRKLKSPNT